MSGQVQGKEVNLDAVNGAAVSDSVVAHEDLLVAFTDAAMGADDALLADKRAELKNALSPAAFVDACATIGAFNVVDRIADATGIPLDEGFAELSENVRSELDLGRFASSANTPGL